MTTEWKPQGIPKLDLHWTCAACFCTEAIGRPATIVPRPGDEDDVVLCDPCHTPANAEIITTGRPYRLSDGTPTWLKGDAELDPALVYRYRLERRWLSNPNKQPGTVLWLLLNPSTADAERPDPTVTRAIGFTHRWGYCHLEVGNLFGYRTSMPHLVPNDIATAVGPHNDRFLHDAMQRASLVIAGWGKPSGKLARLVHDRVAQVRAIAASAGRELMALATSKDGAPTHPMARGTHRIPDDARPRPWEGYR